MSRVRTSGGRYVTSVRPGLTTSTPGEAVGPEGDEEGGGVGSGVGVGVGDGAGLGVGVGVGLGVGVGVGVGLGVGVGVGVGVVGFPGFRVCPPPPGSTERFGGVTTWTCAGVEAGGW